MTENCPCEFPDSVDFGCVMHLVNAVRNNTLADDIPGNLQHAFCLGGSVAKQFISETPQPLGASADECPDTLEAVAEKVAEHCPGDAPQAKTELNPVIVNLLIVLAQKVLERLLK